MVSSLYQFRKRSCEVSPVFYSLDECLQNKCYLFFKVWKHLLIKASRPRAFFDEKLNAYFVFLIELFFDYKIFFDVALFIFSIYSSFSFSKLNLYSYLSISQQIWNPWTAFISKHLVIILRLFPQWGRLLHSWFWKCLPSFLFSL